MERDKLEQLLMPPETPRETMEFLSRSWSVSAVQISKALAPPPPPHNTRGGGAGASEIIDEEDISATVSGNPFSFASSETCQLVMDRITSHSEVSPRTSGRLSHSSGPLNSSVSDSPPLSPSQMDDEPQLNTPVAGHQQKSCAASGSTASTSTTGGRTVGRWLKDRKEKKKQEVRAQNAQLHAAISVAAVAAAIAAIAAATAAASGAGKNEETAENDMAVASAAALVAAQCVEAAEAMGAEREHLASVLSSAVNVQSAGDIATLTAAAATALRGAATLKARALKQVWNIASVIPVDNGNSNGNFSVGICSRELLAKGCELLKRTRKGDLHWKIVSVYINRMGQVMLKMKSKHIAGTLTKKKKNVVVEVMKDIPAWPGRHLLEGGEHRRYFALKTVARGVVEFECKNKREYDVWTQGVSRLLTIATEKNKQKI